MTQTLATPRAAPSLTSFRVFRYGLLPPTLGAATVADQMRAAHRYHNALVEIELARREAERAVLHAHGGLLRSAASSAAPPPDNEGVERDALLTTRRALRLDPVAVAALQRVNAAATLRRTAARAASGVYWGTYLQVERAVDASRRAPGVPRFRRWKGTGFVAVQLQQGLDVVTALGCLDRRFRLDLSPQPIAARHGRPLGRIRLRVASERRNPVWAEWPIVYHRPLPGDARIKWARVVRRLVAGRAIWTLHVTVETAAPWPSPGARGTVAFDLGWRRSAETLRAGGWADDGGASGELLLDPAVRAVLRKVRELRGLRQRSFNELRSWLAGWCQDKVLDAAHGLALRSVSRWRSQGKLAALALWWREHRIAGDAEAFNRIEAWRRRDKHLWQWEANARRKALLRRREQFRIVARLLADGHDTLIVERLCLAALVRDSATGVARQGARASRAQLFEVAPGELRTTLVHAFLSSGRRVFSVPPSTTASEMLRAYTQRLGVASVSASIRGGTFAPRCARLSR